MLISSPVGQHHDPVDEMVKSYCKAYAILVGGEDTSALQVSTVPLVAVGYNSLVLLATQQPLSDPIWVGAKMHLAGE